jgi:glycerol-3-phosphate dehydrogenase
MTVGDDCQAGRLPASRSEIALVVRHEVIRDAEGPMEACQILFGDEAQTRYDEYLSSG